MVKEVITITARDQYTNWVSLPTLTQLYVGGVDGSTVTFQGRPDPASGPYDLESFAQDTFKIIELAHTDWQFRAGVKYDDFGGEAGLIIRLEA